MAAEGVMDLGVGFTKGAAKGLATAIVAPFEVAVHWPLIPGQVQKICETANRFNFTVILRRLTDYQIY